MATAQDTTNWSGAVQWLLANADKVEYDSSTGVTYMGYYKNQSGDNAFTSTQLESKSRWAVCKVTEATVGTTTTTTIEWADRGKNHNLKWSDRASLNYKYKNWD